MRVRIKRDVQKYLAHGSSQKGEGVKALDFVHTVVIHNVNIMIHDVQMEQNQFFG